MTGTVMPPLPDGMTQKAAGSFANSFRVAAVADRLTAHLQFGSVANPTEFFSLCLSLARGIDYAVANNEVPPHAPKLPWLLKEICQRRNDRFLQAAIMVLMISAKNACKFGWFTAEEGEEISALATEIGTNFCSRGDINTTLGDSLSVIKVIMSRFYPHMKMGHILVSLEVKPGYGAYVVDFHISKNTAHSLQEKIRLFVAQIDNAETSACIISPQQVNFLLNGKGVEKRTNVLMDAGPQIPTNVTSMLKYGTNLLQAVGQFSGHFIIAVAFMSVVPLSSIPVLQDYVQSNVAALDPDSDIIEGPSRVSLNCPISYKRIKTPVKGHLCKHLQCFDYRNYIDINSRRPSWRCPHCNQHVCYTDLRVDQNMVKVLKEVARDVADVIISDDGSWKADFLSDTHKDNINNCQKELPEQQEHDSSSPIPPIVMDLTDDDIMDVDISDILDKKPSQATLGSQPIDSNITMQSLLDNAVTLDQDDFWSTIDPDLGSGVTVQPIIPEPPPRPFMTSPMVTHSLSTPLSRGVGIQGNNNLMSSVQNHVSVSGILQVQQQQQLVNNIEYGRLSLVPRNVSRNPIAIQALPAAQAQRARTHLNSMTANGSSLASHTSMSSPQIANTVRQQQVSRSHVNPLMSSLPSHQQSTAQSQQAGSHPTISQVASALRETSRSQTEAQNIQQQYIRRMHVRSPSPGVAQSSSPLMQQQQEAVHMTRQLPSVPVQLETSRVATMNSNSDGIRTPLMSQRPNVSNPQQAIRGSDNYVVDISSEDWRPTGRMRGSITSQAAAAYGDMVIRATTQSAQSLQLQPQAQAQAQPSTTPIPPNVSPSLQAFLANSRSRSLYGSQGQSSPLGQPGSTNGGSGTPQ